ncbi:MAG: late competence development ComFB family protein [Bacillota bacterium]|nr:late competence development ComFB family protein [Bacillota bacterium]
MRKFRDDLYLNTGFENLTESTVLEELYDFAEKLKNEKNSEFCACWICLADVAAIVLNETKPYYCSNFIDKTESKDYLDKFKSEVQQKIVKAFKIVKKNPHHNK